MVIVFLPESTRLNDVMPRPQAKAPKALTPLLEIRNLTKSFDGQHAVDDVSLTIYKGEIFALLGASGCGKSTLLRMLAGFEQPTAGQIMLDGVDLARVPPYQRPINMMFQSYALFPHMTVEQNIAFGLKQDRLPKAEITARVQEMLALVHMQEFAKRKPHQLSGGQRQRVALARSLAKRPKLLLLDEPMGALDKKLRDRMQLEVVDILERVGVTCVMVTHDQEEAMTMAGRIAIMNRGKFVQIGEPEEIYEHPTTRYSAEFIGSVNVFEGLVKERLEDGLVLRSPGLVHPLKVDPDASVVDNVPLVAACMGMYPVMDTAAVAASADPAYMQSFVQDGLFWHLLTYCAGVGGSLLIIGSAAGVVAMGLEKINFGWYFKKITLLAFAGYASGILVILLEHLLVGL